MGQTHRARIAQPIKLENRFSGLENEDEPKSQPKTMSLAESFYMEQQALLQKINGTDEAIKPMPRIPLIVKLDSATSKTAQPEMPPPEQPDERRRETRWPGRRKLGMSSAFASGKAPCHDGCGEECQLEKDGSVGPWESTLTMAAVPKPVVDRIP